MPESNSSVKHVLLAGVISLVVGVTGGLLLNYFTSNRPKLEYAIVTSEAFSGDEAQLAIVALEISNSGKREIEDLAADIQLGQARLREHKVVGLPDGAYQVSLSDSSVALTTAHLNPSEVLSIQLLLDLVGSTMTEPGLSVRAKGVTGTRRVEGDDSRKLPEGLAISFAALLATSTSVLTVLRRSSSRSWSGQHADDQREIAAYALSLYGLSEEADYVRTLARETHYWSISDFVVERSIEIDKIDKALRAVRALQALLDYALIAPTSRRIIELNIAKLAASGGDHTTAREYMAQAVKGGSSVVKKRALPAS